MNNRGKPKSLFICPQKHYTVDCTGDDSTGADPTGADSTGGLPCSKATDKKATSSLFVSCLFVGEKVAFLSAQKATMKIICLP